MLKSREILTRLLKRKMFKTQFLGKTHQAKLAKRTGLSELFNCCGEGGIRTPDDVAAILVFETSRINHSRTSPKVG